MLKIKNKIVLKTVLFFSIFTLGAAYFIQYILGHQPCNLCLIERVPYLLSVIFISLILILKKNEKILVFFVILFFIFGFFVSFYHVGIEQGVFSESLVCDLTGKTNTLSAQDLLKELESKTISCKDITFRFFGLSLATLNTLISLILSAIMYKIFRNYEKN
jgi:disulfide bond formation protein DsbB|tara:strand:+ start:2551 stop:3033 length:483 start_codon:yes stop_codon:yes gene_type:complete